MRHEALVVVEVVAAIGLHEQLLEDIALSANCTNILVEHWQILIVRHLVGEVLLVLVYFKGLLHSRLFQTNCPEPA